MMFDLLSVENFLSGVFNQKISISIDKKYFIVENDKNKFKVKKILWEQYQELEDYIYNSLKKKYPELFL